MWLRIRRKLSRTAYNPQTSLGIRHVCSLWRLLRAFSSPEIWSRISVNLDFQSSICHSTSLQLLKCQLTHAQTYPLSIDFFSPEDTPRARSFMQTLADYSVQWADVNFAAPLTLLDVDSSLVKLSLCLSNVDLGYHSRLSTCGIAPKLLEFHSNLSLSIDITSQLASCSATPLV